MSEQQASASNSEIVFKYNEIKSKYTIYFQKALELEDELREHTYITINKLKLSWKYLINYRKKSKMLENGRRSPR